jgi:hypothetical protein
MVKYRNTMVNLTDGERETREKAINYLKENNLI